MYLQGIVKTGKFTILPVDPVLYMKRYFFPIQWTELQVVVTVCALCHWSFYHASGCCQCWCRHWLYLPTGWRYDIAYCVSHDNHNSAVDIDKVVLQRKT